MSRNTNIPRSVKHAHAPTPGQAKRWLSHQKQTRVKNAAWHYANQEREQLASYSPEQHGPSYTKFRYAVQLNFQEKRKLLLAEVYVRVKKS